MLDIRATLDAIGALDDAEIDLADAALQLGRVDAPDADIGVARAHLSDIARRAAHYEQAADTDDLVFRANCLSDMLCKTFGYSGDTATYNDLANVNLLRVIERRKGMPIALGILWLHAAAAAGWPACGVNMNRHFVIALGDGHEQRLVLDAFNGGRQINAHKVGALVRRGLGQGGPAQLASSLPLMSNRAVLIRLQANIRIRRMEAGDLEGALSCAQTTLRIAPQEPGLWREAAELQERLDQVSAALHSYERVVALAPPGPLADHARAALGGLRARLN